MDRWKLALREGMVTGSIASVASAIALLVTGRRDDGHAAAPLNAVSHWLWDRESLHADAPSLRHTLTGYVVHHGASVFWGTLHARAWGWREEHKRPVPALAGGAAAAAIACFVDYRCTPGRLTPGFEHRLSARSMAWVYACFGLGLAAGSMLLATRGGSRRRNARAAAVPGSPASSSRETPRSP